MFSLVVVEENELEGGGDSSCSLAFGRRIYGYPTWRDPTWIIIDERYPTLYSLHPMVFYSEYGSLSDELEKSMKNFGDKFQNY